MVSDRLLHLRLRNGKGMVRMVLGVMVGGTEEDD